MLSSCGEKNNMVYYSYKDKSRRQLALTTAVSKTNGLLGALACMVMISS